MLSMNTQPTTATGKRLALLPDRPSAAGKKPAIRRYKLARVIEDYGPAFAAPLGDPVGLRLTPPTERRQGTT